MQELSHKCLTPIVVPHSALPFTTCLKQIVRGNLRRDRARSAWRDVENHSPSNILAWIKLHSSHRTLLSCEKTIHRPFLQKKSWLGASHIVCLCETGYSLQWNELSVQRLCVQTEHLFHLGNNCFFIQKVRNYLVGTRASLAIPTCIILELMQIFESYHLANRNSNIIKLMQLSPRFSKLTA